MPKIEDLLRCAAKPLGSTMYVWGGGWNEEDTGAGDSAVTIGISPIWREFFNKQDKNYDFKNHRYEIENGLDCSGYVGWVIYNTFCRTSGDDGFVYPARQIAKKFAYFGWGDYVRSEDVRDICPGDIMSSKSHVIIALGQFRDKSAAFIHSGPPGVQISGTADGVAAKVCNEYMKKYFPQWCEKYPDSSRPAGYLKDFSQMRWNAETMSDCKRIQGMTAEEVLNILPL